MAGSAERLPIALRHPRRVLVVAAVLLALLGVIGIGLEEKLSPSSLSVPGTQSERANGMLREHFGESAPFVVLLRGPEAAVDRQGPALIRTLRRDPAVTTLSPWDRGTVQRLRPGPRRALILVDFHVGIDEAVNEVVPELERALEEQIRPPVRATQTGFATLSRAIQDESIAATERGELIALPILLVVLLLVFRSPIAAAVPLAFGAVTVIASRGLLSIITEWFSIDAFALTVCTMMGLALGVDYALLIVSRFREELAGGADPVEAARATRKTAGRTTVFAGSTLMLSMLVAFFIVPGSLLGSLAATLALVVALSVLVAVVTGPAVLVLLGPNIDRWRVGPVPADSDSRLMALVGAALRRPAPIAAAIGLIVLLLAAPALALKTGPPSQTQLSHDDPARQDFELISRSIGPGYDAPFVIVAATDKGAMTDPARLAALTRSQRRIAALPGVQAVIGPAQVSRAVTPLRENGSRLLAAGTETGPLAQLGRLGRNLGRAALGVSQLREGISKATYGAGLIAQGTDTAEEGAGAIAAGLAQATAGSERAVAALRTFASGTRRLAGAQHRAAFASLQLKFGIQSLPANLRRNALVRARRLQKSLNQDSHVKLPQLIGPAQAANDQLGAALVQLEGMTVGKTDPNYAAALEAVRSARAAVSGTDPVSGQPYAPEYSGLPAELAALQARLLEDAEEAEQVTAWLVSGVILLKRLDSGATRLSDGLRRLETAGGKLARGSARLAGAAATLDDGLTRLGTGATALATGISRLGDGASALEENLALGFTRSYPLESGLRRATVQILSSDARLDNQTRRLRRASPGIFDSGYFVLSALDGARPPLRDRAATAVDLNGGQAATMLVISRYTFNTPGSIALNKRLEGEADDLAREAGVATGVAGGASTLNDYSTTTRARIPLVVAAITLATFLVLVLVLRALPLAAIAVGLNLATVAVAFGVLTLLFNLPEGWPLGGHEYVDAVGATAIFGVVFGLSIDYAVFLLVRMREHYDAGHPHAEAIEFGLAKTARVITGAAAIMMAVFVAFAGAPIATVSQLGIGLTVAVLLDATVVRIVLLPALMLLLGERVWWLPRSLDRALPRLNV
ncbi:MAG TPA: MMPL family transporter [Solirubrobacterales bacterium]|nr:MMPL family transporter [Solirubrobacterales bacterium]